MGWGRPGESNQKVMQSRRESEMTVRELVRHGNEIR